MSTGLPVRVLQVLHTDRDSGPQRSLLPRLEYLRDHGASVVSLVPGYGPAVALAEHLGPVAIGGTGAQTVPKSAREAWNALGNARTSTGAVFQAAFSHNADLVVVTSALIPGAICGARRAQAGVLVYAGEHLPSGGVKGLMSGAVTRAVARSNASIITCSNHAAQNYRRRGLNVTVIWPPITMPSATHGELAERGMGLRSDLGLDHSQVLISALGAITEGRGQDTLIRAVRHLLDSDLDVHLVIGGEPYNRRQDHAFRQQLINLARQLGLNDRVHFVGHVEDPLKLFAASSIFVNPARFPEPFGRASVEALASGCPVVSTNVGGVHEALSESGVALLVPPDSPREIARAASSLIDDPHFATEMTTRGKRMVANRLSPEAGMPAFHEAVRSALSARR